MRIIKKYQNRKLYDMKSNKYITLDQIITLIKNNEEIKIIDQKSDLDITHDTLKKCLLSIYIPYDTIVTIIKGK
jgi:polyhydroxyalkanoate synthesis repressor PhaR